MPDLRLTGVRKAALGAAGAGLILGAVAWVLFGGGSRAEEQLEGQQIRLQAAPLTAPRTSQAPQLIALATDHPLFALTTGPGAVAEVLVRLDGVARSSQRQAALIALNGGEAQWLERGASRGGVTLEEVQSSRVVVETALGRREIALGEQPPAPQGPSVQMLTGPAIPAGVRLPPPPASAPARP